MDEISFPRSGNGLNRYRSTTPRGLIPPDEVEARPDRVGTAIGRSLIPPSAESSLVPLWAGRKSPLSANLRSSGRSQRRSVLSNFAALR